MRLAAEQIRKTTVADCDASQLSVFGVGQRRPPSQKELAGIFMVTTRHLRRWETAEQASNHPCSRPYSHADLWRRYQRRGCKGWDRAFAARLGLADVFERFDEMRLGCGESGSGNSQSVVAAMMLRSVVADNLMPSTDTELTPRMFGAELAVAAKIQLRAILRCERSREILVKAFFEAALVAEARSGISCAVREETSLAVNTRSA